MPRKPKYIRAKLDIIELLKDKRIPMSVDEMHYALIWKYNIQPIRQAAYELERQEIITFFFTETPTRKLRAYFTQDYLDGLCKANPAMPGLTMKQVILDADHHFL